MPSYTRRWIWQTMSWWRSNECSLYRPNTNPSRTTTHRLSVTFCSNSDPRSTSRLCTVYCFAAIATAKGKWFGILDGGVCGAHEPDQEPNWWMIRGVPETEDDGSCFVQDGRHLIFIRFLFELPLRRQLIIDAVLWIQSRSRNIHGIEGEWLRLMTGRVNDVHLVAAQWGHVVQVLETKHQHHGDADDGQTRLAVSIVNIVQENGRKSPPILTTVAGGQLFRHVLQRLTF